MKVNVRKISKITKKDFEDVRRLIQVLYPNLKKSITYDDYKKVVRSDGADIFVAKYNNKIVGISLLSHYFKIGGIICIIEDVVVDESLRGSGIGRLLVNNMIKRAKKLGADFIDVDTRMKGANDFYLKLKFQPKDLKRPYYALRMYF